MTLQEFFDVVEKAKKEATPEQLKEKMKLYVGSAKWQAEMQSGEWGDSTDLYSVFLSGNTLHVN